MVYLINTSIKVINVKDKAIQSQMSRTPGEAQ